MNADAIQSQPLNDRAPRPHAAADERSVEAAWQRVLDCGAPGPGRERPILFYQDEPAPAQPAER
jgi:hypothetical protein